MGAPLAIVIPAYKACFLDETLRSIAAQTRRDFVVYVGDDASPEDVAAVCERWRGHLDLRYHRFATNLGGRDLVAQWTRCVALASEPWVWLFGDDDRMPPAAVDCLLQAWLADGERFDLYHFNVEEIDAAGRVNRIERAYPQDLAVRDYVRERLAFRLASYAPDYVFRRSAFEAAGGFVSFPHAWGADDATWVRLGWRAGIRTLEGPRVQWRLSGQNISSRREDAMPKLQAQLDLLLWLQAFLAEHPPRAGEPGDGQVLQGAAPWFFHQAKLLRTTIPPPLARRTCSVLRRVCGTSGARSALELARLDLRARVITLRRQLRGH